MEKRKWLWTRKSSDRSSGESDSSGSISSPSERYSDEQDILKESAYNNAQSPEVTSKATVIDDEIKDSIKSLTQKLSAALVNVSAKEDLAKQHAKVAEEAVAGWEKAENEVATLKQQLEAAVQQNVALEVRASHLDGALKECVRQLRHAKEEQEQRIPDAAETQTSEWELIKAELENRILELQTCIDASKARSPVPTDADVLCKLEFLEEENSALKAELLSRSEDLEIRTIERDLSTQAAETASKQQLESIKKVAKLEAECRRLQAIARKSAAINDQKSIAASSTYIESLTDSHSGSGEQVNAVDIGSHKMSKFDHYNSEPSCSDSCASALIAELDQFTNGKAKTRNLAANSVEIDMMDDFLEMERLAALHDTKRKIASAESSAVVDQSSNASNTTKAELESMTRRLAELEERLLSIGAEKAELEAKLEAATNHVAELQEKIVKAEVEKAALENVTTYLSELEEELVKIEAEKVELENALIMSQESLGASQAQLKETEIKLEQLQKELVLIHESKELLEFQLVGMEVETRTMAENIDSLKTEVEKEQNSSAEMAAKYQELEKELKRKAQEVELQQMADPNHDVKLKQEDFAVAADKFAECQKTIASLGRQLQSLATLEDFLIDTAKLPGLSGGASLVPRAHGESWKLHSNGTYVTTRDLDPPETPGEIASHSLNGNDMDSPASSSSSTSSANLTASSSKSRNGFGKLFSRSKSSIQMENQG